MTDVPGTPSWGIPKESGMPSGQVSADPEGNAQKPTLYSFVDRWELDGEFLRCRRCKRQQLLSYALQDFRHAYGCKGAAWERNPWLRLSSLIAVGSPAQMTLPMSAETVIPPGYALVPLEPTPEAVSAWWRVKNGHHFHDEPPPEDTSDYAAYRALVLVAAKDNKQMEIDHVG